MLINQNINNTTYKFYQKAPETEKKKIMKIEKNNRLFELLKELKIVSKWMGDIKNKTESFRSKVYIGQIGRSLKTRWTEPKNTFRISLLRIDDFNSNKPSLLKSLCLIITTNLSSQNIKLKFGSQLADYCWQLYIPIRVFFGVTNRLVSYI